MTEEELLTCIKLGRDEGAISADEKNMLSRVFTLNDKTVSETMTPDKEMVTLDVNSYYDKIFNIILKTVHSCFPIMESSDIIGFIHAKDLFGLINKKKASFRDFIRLAYFVDANKKIDPQLRSFQARKFHQAVVLNKEGGVIGLITLEDILEELVGSIKDEHD